jgi:hypothetical protein
MRADITGAVTGVYPADAPLRARGMLGSILVEALEGETITYDKASVAITEQTRIIEQVGQERRPATFEALQVGQKVQVQFTGPVMESYPVQAMADVVVILK